MLYFLQGDYHLLSPFQQKAQLWILSFKLLSHLETYAHAIVAVGDGTHCAESRAALEGTQHLDEVEKLLLVEEKTDAIGGLGGIARSTQQKSLQLPCHGLPSICAEKLPSVVKVNWVFELLKPNLL